MSDDQLTCGLCGLMAASPLPLTWSTQSSSRGVTLVCERCTRDNLRAIEAKLEPEWW